MARPLSPLRTILMIALNMCIVSAGSRSPGAPPCPTRNGSSSDQVVPQEANEAEGLTPEFLRGLPENPERRRSLSRRRSLLTGGRRQLGPYPPHSIRTEARQAPHASRDRRAAQLVASDRVHEWIIEGTVDWTDGGYLITAPYPYPPDEGPTRRPETRNRRVPSESTVARIVSLSTRTGFFNFVVPGDRGMEWDSRVVPEGDPQSDEQQ